MKVLAIGQNSVAFTRQIFQDAVIDRGELLEHGKKGPYDAVMVYMALQTIPYQGVTNAIKSWLAVLKQGGEITFMVPSLEWAAVQVLSKERSPVLLAHLFGTQDNGKDFYKSAFTMMDLRSLCTVTNISVTHAATGEYTIGDNVCELHTVRGVKK